MCFLAAVTCSKGVLAAGGGSRVHNAGPKVPKFVAILENRVLALDMGKEGKKYSDPNDTKNQHAETQKRSLKCHVWMPLWNPEPDQDLMPSSCLWTTCRRFRRCDVSRRCELEIVGSKCNELLRVTWGSRKGTGQNHEGIRKLLKFPWPFQSPCCGEVLIRRLLCSMASASWAEPQPLLQKHKVAT